MVAALHDPSSAVVRQATAALRPRAASLPERPLRELLTAPQRHHRRAAYTLLHQRAGWTPLRAALVLADDPDPKLAHRAQVDLVRWTRYVTDPDGPVPDDLEPLITRAAAHLEQDVVRVLRTRTATPRRTPRRERP